MTLDPELVHRYHGLYAPLVSDCVDDLGLGSFSFPPGLMPFHADLLRVVVGPAHTCQFEVTAAPEELDVGRLLEVCDSTAAGTVTVAACNGEPSFALWGGLMSTGTAARGGLGAVVDGPVRDIAQVRGIGFAVWGRSQTPRDIRQRGQVRSIDRPVVFQGITVNPGDLVVADGNGAAIVPRGRELEVLEACEERMPRENLTQQELQGTGQLLSEIYARHRAI